MRLSTTLFYTLILAGTALRISATTIRPFTNLGEMAKACDAVVHGLVLDQYTILENGETRYRFSLRVQDPVKGKMPKNQRIEIQNFHLKVGDLERAVWGDLELQKGKEYLLFLNQLQEDVWQATMLSYAAFEQREIRGEKMYVPFALGNEAHQNYANEIVPPLEIYRVAELVPLLKSVVHQEVIWDDARLNTLDMQDLPSHQRGAAPSHCTFVSSTPWARWQDLSISNLSVRYHRSGDPGCSSAVSQISSAINTMGNSYAGVNLNLASAHNFNPSCSGGQGATDVEFTDYVDNTYGNNRQLLIQFNDPCNEIANLSGCNGTYAIGGLYWYSSQHSFNGMNWRNAAYGYVVINNGASACSCGDGYINLMIHEMSHSLNIGHIASSAGTANMNGSGLSDITGLDQQCLNFVYADGALPVSLTDFWGEANSLRVSLLWYTSSEANNDYFTIEKKIAEDRFVAIGQVQGAGTSTVENMYQFDDLEPDVGDNYYRLTQTDFDGHQSQIETIIIPYYIPLSVSITPNPMSGNVLRAEIATDVDQPIEVSIHDWVGHPIYRQRRSTRKGIEAIELWLADLAVGIYFLKVSQDGRTETHRFVKV